MRRSLAALALVVFLAVLLAAGSAGAGFDVSVSFVEAGSGADPRDYTPPADSVLTGTRSVVADASASSYLKTFRVSIEPDDSGNSLPPEATVSRSYPTGDKTSDRIKIIWDTTKLTRYNGAYHLVATATSQLGNLETATVGGLKVNNPPQVPTGVVAEVKDREAVVAWTANTEPDIFGYRVLRSDDGEPFTQVGFTAAAGFRETKAPARVELRYKVIAVRSSPVTQTGVLSAASQATTRIVIVPPEDPATHSLVDQAPQANPVKPAEKALVGARRDVGFAPLLPYSSDLLTAPAAAASESQAQEDPGPALITRTIQKVIETTVYRPPYIAAALILLTVALQILWVARRLLTTA